jgi:hypothetical protein
VRWAEEAAAAAFQRWGRLRRSERRWKHLQHRRGEGKVRGNLNWTEKPWRRCSPERGGRGGVRLRNRRGRRLSGVLAGKEAKGGLECCTSSSARKKKNARGEKGRHRRSIPFNAGRGSPPPFSFSVTRATPTCDCRQPRLVVASSSSPPIWPQACSSNTRLRGSDRG